MPGAVRIPPKTHDTQEDVVDFLLRKAGDDVSVYTVQPKEESEDIHEASEGQLAVDIFDADDKLYVVAAVAGADPRDIDVHVHADILTIRGRRVFPVPEENGEYVHRECFWGAFSRSVILPFDVRAVGVRAVYRDGVLIVALPKEKREKKVPIMVVEG